MKDLIDAKTREALAIYGDAASEEFYRRLREKKLCSTRCQRCGQVAFPPRDFCPSCHAAESDIEWVELPRRAKLYAFTQQQRALRFLPPDVLGLVEVDGVGHFLSRIDAPFEKLAIGQELEVSFLEIAPDLWVHEYRPV